MVFHGMFVAAWYRALYFMSCLVIIVTFLAHLDGVQEELLYVSKILKFYVKVFYVMGKVLSGELSCPCDRSCLVSSNCPAEIASLWKRLLFIITQSALDISNTNISEYPHISKNTL